MERRFEIQKRKILKEADVKPQVLNGMLKRLEQFVKPFIASLGRREPKENVHIYISGLLSDLRRKNVESIAYRYDRDRRALQRFIGFAPWDHQPLQQELARQIGNELDEDDGVIVFDPSGHKKCGNDSVGVQRQWLGRLGKVDNGQVGIYMGYASRKEHALADVRFIILLYLAGSLTSFADIVYENDYEGETVGGAFPAWNWGDNGTVHNAVYADYDGNIVVEHTGTIGNSTTAARNMRFGSEWDITLSGNTSSDPADYFIAFDIRSVSGNWDPINLEF